MVFPTREIKDKNAEKFNILKIANKHDMGCYVRVSEREGCHLSQFLTDGKIQKWSGGSCPGCVMSMLLSVPVDWSFRQESTGLGRWIGGALTCSSKDLSSVEV